MENYADLMFTSAVQAEQDRHGNRAIYAKKYSARTQSDLGPDETSFLESRTSFYIASVSETGWPYLQHRGGPAGFLKVLDDQTIGFADYRGNRQYISKGNLSGDDRVSLFAMDYSRQARLKLQGHASMVDAAEDFDLANNLDTPNQGRIERIATIRVVAFDWNCSQFIAPRFTEDEVTAMVSPHLASRDRKIAALSNRLKDLGQDPELPL